MEKTLNTLFVIASMGLAVSALIFISISIFSDTYAYCNGDCFTGSFICFLRVELERLYSYFRILWSDGFRD